MDLPRSLRRTNGAIVRKGRGSSILRRYDVLAPWFVEPDHKWVRHNGVTAGEARAKLAMQLVCGLRNLATVVAGSLELVRGRQPRAIASSDRRGTVGRTAGNLAKRHLPSMAVIEPDNHHPEVQEIGNHRKQCRLLAAMLRSSRGKRAADFTVQCSTRPKPTGLIQKICHL